MSGHKISYKYFCNTENKWIIEERNSMLERSNTYYKK